MSTNTRTNDARLSALESDIAEIKDMLRMLAQQAPDAPARVTPPAASAQVSAPDAPTKVLSKGAWKALRTTRNGKVRAAFAGLTREEAFEAGLCPGFHLPTDARREAIREFKAAQEA